MLKKIIFIISWACLIVWWVYAYQAKLTNTVIAHNQEEVARAYNNFYPSEQNYRFPLKGYDYDGLADVLYHYRWDAHHQKVTYTPRQWSSFSMSGVDSSSFLPINQNRSKDNSSLYFKGEALLALQGDAQFLAGWWYLANGSGVYFFDGLSFSPLLGVDVSTLEPLFSREYSSMLPYLKDATHVYFRDMILEGIDPATVEILSSFYIRDHKDIVYFDGENLIRLSDVDHESFMVVNGNGYDAKDASWHYFFQGQKVDMIEFG